MMVAVNKIATASKVIKMAPSQNEIDDSQQKTNSIVLADATKNRDAIEEALFDNVENIDADEDFWFKLRGNSINLLIDVAEPLLGMVCRVKHMSRFDGIDELYQQVVDEIRVIDTELAANGYEKAVLLSYRYILCTFIDESIMGTKWGSGIWAQHSLLTRFHNETWGGEKVFSILSRIESDPKRYRELLEFIYLCFCLGFGGRYRVEKNTQNDAKFEQIVTDLHELLHLDQPELLDGPLSIPANQNVLKTKNSLNKRIPLWSVFATFGIGLAAIFSYFYFTLAQQSNDVLDKLNQILN